MSVPPKMFPIILICFQLGACAVYAMHGDHRRTIYWIAGALITAAVTF